MTNRTQDVTQVLLPQWAESLHPAHIAQFQGLRDWLTRLAESVYEVVTTAITAFAEAVQPILDAVERALCPTCHKRPKRSSRRLKVQAKRKALGLTGEGKLPNHAFTRKQSLHIATLQARAMTVRVTGIEATWSIGE